jgi:simple sugar transport system permease protein
MLIALLATTIQSATSLLYATLGEIFTERSGILNMGVEGMMMMGAVLGFAVSINTDSVCIGLLMAMVVGGLLAMLHGIVTIVFRADQTVSGLALSILGGGLANFLGQRVGPGGTSLVALSGPKLEEIPIPLLSKIPILGPTLFTQDVMTYAIYLLVPLAAFFLFRTRPGLHLRAVGENPQTADAMGINVNRTRFIYTIIGGLFAGLAGAHLSLCYSPGWTDDLTAGRGWIAIALVIFAAWNPGRAILGAILFSGIGALQFRLQAIGTDIPSPILNSLPYIFTIVALVLITWRERSNKSIGTPASLGSVYVREEKR